MELRYYQIEAIDMLHQWWTENPTGDVVISMPGGSGKSVVIGEICKRSLMNWPDTKILMAVHSRKLISQNAAKLRQLWPGAPLGIYSAGLKKKQLGEPITYAGILSIAKKAELLGHIDILLVDEAHAISNEEVGSYRKLIFKLKAINPNLRVVGFSASPYRVGQGLLTEGKNALFKAILEPVFIEELLDLGHLCPLRSKQTDLKFDTSGLHTRKGDYIEKEMAERFNTSSQNIGLAQEVIWRAHDRKHILGFASNVDHARELAECFRAHGVSADYICGDHTTDEQDDKIEDFESGKTRVLINFGILTTGYDFPALDCIFFARATKSPGLYGQMAMRGMRPFITKLYCLVLDFAGVIEQNGPITAIRVPKAKGSGGGEAPIKVCDTCNELVPISLMTCPACGAKFPEPKEKKLILRNDDILGIESSELVVKEWKWRSHFSKNSGKGMLKLAYYGGLIDPVVTEYFPLLHDGYARKKALDQFKTMPDIGQIELDDVREDELEDVAKYLNGFKPPVSIEYRKDGRFHKVIRRIWNEHMVN